MKIVAVLFFVVLSFVNVFGQTGADLQKLYNVEKEFEKFVAENGINRAFIEFLAPDGVIFYPNPVNAREFYKNRAASPASLTWNPTFVDVSSNGALGYTTGSGVYRANGKDDANAFYSEYVSIWQRQPDKSYKAVLDIGVARPKPEKIETAWKFPTDAGVELNEKNSSAADYANSFYEIAARSGLEKAYKIFAADDARLLREGKTPVTGKDNLLAEIKKDKSSVAFAKRSVFFGAADMAYVYNTYALTKTDKTTEKGNFVQIWKLRGGKWKIVLDVFSPIPNETK